MINLLPKKEKEELIFERNKKLVMVLGNMAIISIVALILVLFSLKFYILQQLVAQDIILTSVQKEYQDPGFLEAKENMQKYNSTIVKMDNFYKKQIYFSENLRLISEIERPKGVYFTRMKVENGKDNKVNVSIAGFSNSRENLEIFRSNLEGAQNSDSSNKIENIYFPADVWLKSRDINFSLTFDIVKK